MSSLHYISRYASIHGMHSMYHNNVILFGATELSQVIFPGLFHELKTRSKYPEMFANTISSPSRYTLPSYISPDKLTEELRTVLSSAFIFIHTWIHENMNETNSKMQAEIYDNEYIIYEEFFETIFPMIIANESDAIIRDTAIDLHASLQRLYPYLGSYHGNLANCVFAARDLLLAFVYLYYMSLVCSRLSEVIDA